MINVNIARDPCICSFDDDGNLVIGDACVSAPGISDSMIETEIVAQEAGTAYLDGVCSNRMDLTCSGYILGWTDPGTFCHINYSGQTHSCVVDAIEIEVNVEDGLFEVNTHMKFEREDNE